MNKNFFRSVYNPTEISRTVCIFSGRFQPFGPHHYQAYLNLCAKFGVDNVFVATSNNTDDSEKNPLNFQEKKSVMEKFGVKNIFQVSSPYRPIEITSNLPDNTALVLALGEKDSDRKLISKNGYYSEYKSGIQLNPYRKNGYIYHIPEIKLRWNGEEISGTTLRKYLANCKSIQFKEIMGWWDPYLQKLFSDKFTSRNLTNMTEIFEEIKTVQENKHLKHPWEQLSWTYLDLVELIKLSLLGKLDNVTEKIDGQNILVTVRNGEILFARNKTEIKNPLSPTEFLSKFNGKPAEVIHAFTWAVSTLKAAFNSIDLFAKSEFFSESRFLNLEIVDPSNYNVIQYGSSPFLILHSFVDYDESGNELVRNIKLAEKFSNLISVRHILPPRKIVLNSVYNVSKKIDEFKEILDSTWKKYGLKESDTVLTYYDKCQETEPKKLSKDALIRKYQYPFEILFSRIGYAILSEIDHTLCKSPFSSISNIRKNIARVSTQIHKEANPDKLRKLQTEMGKLNAIGGSDVILAIEGIVFNFNGSLVKYTGSFRFVNQILGINRYSR